MTPAVRRLHDALDAGYAHPGIDTDINLARAMAGVHAERLVEALERPGLSGGAPDEVEAYEARRHRDQRVATNLALKSLVYVVGASKAAIEIRKLEKPFEALEHINASIAVRRVPDELKARRLRAVKGDRD